MYARIKLAIIALFLVGAGFTFYHFILSPKDSASKVATNTAAESEEHVNRAYTTLASFTSEQFKSAFDGMDHPNTKPIIKRLKLFDDPAIDDYIYDQAENRGYKLRPVANGRLNNYKGIEVQELLIEDWESMIATAQQDGIEMLLVSGYRSVQEQTELFRERLIEAGLSSASILTGSEDGKLDFLLSTTAPPGYSRHHSGYTIDIETPGYAVFDGSPAEEWLSANNYENAKKFGFIPSYPPDLPNQGPNPEPWEYVWIGKDVTFVTE